MSLTSLWIQSRAASLLLTATPGMMLLTTAEPASAQITPVCERTAQVRDAIVQKAGVSDCGAVTEAHLEAIRQLDLSRDIATLKAGDFSGLNTLEWLFLSDNALTTLEPGIFDGLNTLEELNLAGNGLTTLESGIFNELNTLEILNLAGNRVGRLPITISLERVEEDRFQAKAHTGAPFAILLPVQITNGSLLGEASHITIPTGRRTSDILTVSHTAGTSDAITVDIGPLPQLPPDHNGYTLVKSADLPLHLSGVATAVEVTTLAIPTISGLDPNFPNPFNASTQIAYRLATPGLVRLEIYNVLGQPVHTLANQFQPAGFYQVRWDAGDQRGAPLAAGVYLTRLRHPDGAQTRRLLYLK